MFNPVASLDPARKGDYQSYWVTEAAYDGLTNWGQEPTRLEAGLATAWRSNADATRWIFDLRRGVTFHDGTALTPTAVRKTFEHYKSGKGSYMGAYVGDFIRGDDSDPDRVVVEYEKPFPDLARNAPWLGIISARALEGTPDEVATRLDRRSAGAGAFVVTRDADGATVTARAFDAYWGSGPFLEELVFRSVPEATAREAALRSGDLDWIPQVAPQTLADLRTAYSTSSVVSWLQFMLLFATDLAPTDDASIRQAIAYAVNREAILRAVLLEQGEIAKSNIPTGCYGSAPTPTQYPFDAEKARALVQSAGGDLPEVVITHAPGQQIAIQIAQVIADQLRDVGLDATAIPSTPAISANEFDGTKRRRYAINLEQFGWINGGPFFFAPGGAFNLAALCRYRDAAFEQLMEKASGVADGPRRLAAIAAMQESFTRAMVTFPLFNLTTTDVFARDLHGYVAPKDGFGPRFNNTYSSAAS